MDIGGWLRSLELEEYEPAFRKNKIDERVLPSLTNADLKELGVIPIGDRRRLLDAVAALRANKSAEAAAAAPQPVDTTSKDNAERRQVAGMSSDLVGSTVLSARTDIAGGPGELGSTPGRREQPESAAGESGARMAARVEPAPSEAALEAGDAIQRRQLTLMFCDLVGSTALATHLDLEDLHELMREYEAVCRRVVAAYGGFVARFIGDGMLAYFGYPRADEDAAERAVRAGLDLVSAIACLHQPAGEPLAARVAIATGMVVVGDLDGEGASAVVGSTPNLAARLQNFAEPGTVVLEAATQSLLGTRFVLRRLGDLQVKGFAEMITAWAVEAEGSSESRFQAARTTCLTCFTGRQWELEVLAERKATAWAGDGQVVLISGEPGIGKSRLTALFSEQLKVEAHTRLLYQCSPYHTDSGLYPFIEQLKRAAKFEPNDTPERQLDKLEAAIARATPGVASIAPLLATLLSLPIAGRYALPRLSPAQQRRQTFAGLLDLLEGLASRRPVLLIVEDVHWADATSRELFDLAIERIRRLPILAIVTYRPEFEPRWETLPNVVTLALKPLEPAQVQAMVGQLTGGRNLPSRVLNHIVAKTDGVPLFIEEFTRNLLESGLLREGQDRFVPSEPALTRGLPTTLQDSLLARLDRLGRTAKEAAQVAAVIGREFLYGLLEAISPLPRERLQLALAGLVQAGLLSEQGNPSHPRYVFRHALIADTAYSTLLRGRRRELHGRIARALEQAFPEIADTEPELVAHHLTEGGFGEAAIDWWEKAALVALRRGAYFEATRHLGRAIELLGSQHADRERDRRELGLRMRLRLPLLIAKGYGTEEADPNYRRLEQLAESLAATDEMLSVLNGRCIVANIRCDFTAAMGHAQRLIVLACRLGDANGVAVSHYHLALGCSLRGELSAARVSLSEARAHCSPEGSASCRERYSFDLGPSLSSLQCLVLQQSGFLDQAASLATETLAEATRNPNAPTQFIAFRNLAFFHMIRRNAAGVEQLAAELEKLAQHNDGLEWHIHAELCSAWVRARASRLEKDMQLAATRVNEALKTRMMAPIYLLQEAELLLEIKRDEQALHRLGLAQTLIEETGQRLFKPEADRLRGLARCSDPDAADDAEAHFASAIRWARQNDMKLWELRATMSCAEFWRDSGRPRKAQCLLEPVYGSFSEGCDTADLKQARALLDTLALGAGTIALSGR